jgi:hypothetical protein
MTLRADNRRGAIFENFLDKISTTHCPWTLLENSSKYIMRSEVGQIRSLAKLKEKLEFPHIFPAK